MEMYTLLEKSDDDDNLFEECFTQSPCKYTFYDGGHLTVSFISLIYKQ